MEFGWLCFFCFMLVSREEREQQIHSKEQLRSFHLLTPLPLANKGIWARLHRAPERPTFLHTTRSYPGPCLLCVVV